MNQESTAFPALVFRLIVGGLFVVAAIGKIDEPTQFVKEIRQYEMAPFALTNAMAYTLPWLELITGGLFALGVWRRETGFLIAAMLVVFTIAKAIAFAQGRVIECGCGGSFEALKYIFNNPQGIVTNVVLLIMTAFGVFLGNRTTGVDRQTPEAPASTPA